MSPVFCDVANRPSSAPVRRDVASISGVSAGSVPRCPLTIGFRQCRPPGVK